MARDISEREFVNYARGLGNYCTYGDARRAVVAVLEALAVSYPAAMEAVAGLLPPGVRGLVSEAAHAATSLPPADSPGREEFLEILRSTAGLSADDRPGHTLRAFLGTVKEKAQERKDEWHAVLPPPLRDDWEQSITIDQVQDAGQCL